MAATDTIRATDSVTVGFGYEDYGIWCMGSYGGHGYESILVM